MGKITAVKKAIKVEGFGSVVTVRKVVNRYAMYHNPRYRVYYTNQEDEKRIREILVDCGCELGLTEERLDSDYEVVGYFTQFYEEQ